MLQLLTVKSVVCGLFFFFFQAEDGIRDYKVTGVQTCALPISDKSSFSAALFDSAAEKLDLSARAYVRSVKVARTIADLAKSDIIEPEHISEEIGRASCRERV